MRITSHEKNGEPGRQREYGATSRNRKRLGVLGAWKGGQCGWRRGGGELGAGRSEEQGGGLFGGCWESDCYSNSKGMLLTAFSWA